jgi:putative CocE/NonD family hydrolase
MRRFLRYLLGALVALVIGLAMAPALVTLPGEEPTPLGPARNESRYLTMRDSTRIAVDIWYPATLQPGQRVPTLIRGTRYVRAWDIGWGARLLAALNLGRAGSPSFGTDLFNREGFAVVIVDARGTGASFGNVTIPWSPDEVADYHEVIAWIAARDWSNGKVGALGISYDGNAAETMAAGAPAALRAVAPLFHNFDTHFYLATAGGVFNDAFVKKWSDVTQQMDRNKPLDCAGLGCVWLRAQTSGAKCVDEDRGCALRDEAVRTRQISVPYEATQDNLFRDQSWGGSGLTLTDVSPVGRRAQIERSGLPMFVLAGWLDSATVDGAIARFRTFSNPQQVLIGGLAHGGFHDTDPFKPADAAPDPTIEEQYRALVAFFRDHLGDGPAPAPVHELRYYTMGAGRWNTTTKWPPAGFEANTAWFFGPDRTLVRQPPAADEGSDRYEVDVTATTGAASRWITSIGGPDVIYPDRAEADGKLLTYTSDPLPEDIEITGHPIVILFMAATTEDAALHVYLEDVAPNGWVTYLTEGVFRAIHRKLDDSAPLYVTTGPRHSFRREDAMPLVPGQVAEAAFALYPTSVVLRQGHRIRVAIAGADTPQFRRPAEDGVAPVFDVQRSRSYPSRIELPRRVLLR